MNFFNIHKFLMFALLGVGITAFQACTGGYNGSLTSLNVAGGPPDTPFTIWDASKLIGGPIATGRIGDVLLENDKIRIIIEQPGKNPWVGNFGGGIIDADIVRDGGAGQDNFGFMHPLLNIEWTVNVFDYEVVKDGTDGGPKVFRTYGVVDVYDYLDIDFISPVAREMTDQSLYFAPRFDDVNDPFNLTELKNLNTQIVTDYILEPGKNYVTIETTFENLGDEEIYIPVGEYVNGSGEVMFLIPGLGFTPELMPQIQGDTPALIYVAFENSDVSYGYFYDVSQFMFKDEEGNLKRSKTTSLSYSGITGILFGEDFLKVLPLGNRGEPKINFSIPARDKKTVRRYFVVGNGNGGSVFDIGLDVLGVSTNTVSGVVKSANGQPVFGATVAVKNEEDSTIITYRTDPHGKFSGRLSTGATSVDRAFGSGKYKISVYKRGYRVSGTSDSGTCSPGEISVVGRSVSDVVCTLGDGGIVKIEGGVVDEDSGQKIPARLTVVGYIPSFRSKTGGHFEDKIIFERPLGVVDVYYVNAKGTIGIEGADSVRLPAGKYELFFSHGVEYSTARIPVSVSGENVVTVGPVNLKRVIDTSGFISADFHLHSIVSPDSAMRPERRVLAAAGEGMDILQSSDHDYLVDYAPYVEKLAAEGLIRSGSINPITGDEISPNHIGHFNVFPLEAGAGLPAGGALDWGITVDEVNGPEPDFVMSPQDIVDYYRDMPGERIIQINHIADMATSLLILGGWVTSPAYYDVFGVSPLSSYADPVLNRLKPKASSAEYPFPFGSSETVVTDADAIELVIGPELHDNLLLTSGLPNWFNLLNLGLNFTATGNSDSHREIANPLGIPRNFIASSVDPANGISDFSKFNVDEYVDAIKKHKVIVTTGPFVSAHVTDAGGNIFSIGETAVGNLVKLIVDVKSPDWAWFDTVEIFANTEPLPADDDNLIPFEGKAANPADFFAPYHIPRFYYQPSYKFSLKDKTLTEWKKEDGVISARVEIDLNLERDSWVVVFVRGTEETEGYHSLFPFVTHALVDADNPSSEPQEADMGNVDMLSLTGAPAWAFTNPIFIDADGNGYNALYATEWDFIGKGGAKKSASPTPNPIIRQTIIQTAPKNTSATSVNSNLL